MSLPESGHDDRELARYLLGLLPEDEAERLDELSLADDDVAWRLRAAEDDLVDAYVRGALAGETREQFEFFYLSSPRRRDKVAFAEALLRTADAAVAPTNMREVSGESRVSPPPEKSAPPSIDPAVHRPIRRSTFIWSLAAAAALPLVISGALLFQQAQLRHELSQAQTAGAALTHRAQELEQQLSLQSSARDDVARELERVRASLAELSRRSSSGTGPGQPEPASSLATIALVLLPQTRAGGQAASLVVPPAASRVTFDLRLESNDFPRYQVALKDPATSRIAWRSGRVGPRSSGEGPTVSISIPATLLSRAQHYSLELTGYSGNGNGDGEVVGSYTFQVTPR